MLLGDGAIERGSVIVGRDGHVELGFRHDHFCAILNLIEERSRSFGFMRESSSYKNDVGGPIVSWRRTGAFEG